MHLRVFNPCMGSHALMWIMHLRVLNPCMGFHALMCIMHLRVLNPCIDFHALLCIILVSSAYVRQKHPELWGWRKGVVIANWNFNPYRYITHGKHWTFDSFKYIIQMQEFPTIIFFMFYFGSAWRLYMYMTHNIDFFCSQNIHNGLIFNSFDITPN